MPNEYDISRAFKRIENELIDSMMRNMKRHQVEEAELGKEWEQWQAVQLAELEEYRKKNLKRFSGDFSDIQDKIDDLFYATYNDAQSAEEHRLIDRIKKGDFKPTEDKGSFFRLNEPKLNALIMATQADFARAEYAMLRRANDQYRKIIFDSMAYANVTNDYAKAVDMATHDFLKAGINSVVYKNGARHTVADYAYMALRTGNKRAYLMGEGNAHDRYGLHTVRVNKRTHACPKCVGFLGRLLIDDVYGGGTRAEALAKGIPTLSDAMQAGFLHPNCKDIYSAYIEGVSQPAKPWTQEEVGEIVGEYNQEQQLKHAEDMKDSYERMAKYSLDPSNQQTYQTRADNWQARIDEIKNTPVKPVAPPQPVVVDTATELRNKLAEAEAEYRKAHELERQWTFDKDNLMLHKSMAQIKRQELDEYLENELRLAREDYANDPNDINKRSLERIERVVKNKDELEKGDKLKQLRADLKAKEKEVDRLKAELGAELDRIDQLNQGEATFDRDAVEWSKMGELLKNNMVKHGVEYREVKLLDRELTDDELIRKLAGGDMTTGSCMSLAQAYSANKCGLDVIDYRGGQSQYVMSYASRNIMNLKGLTPMVEQGETIRPAKALLKNVVEGKEYYFITGRHASIVRRVDGKLQYLELQSAKNSGWHFFEGDDILFKGTSYEQTVHKTVSDTLRDRFACNRGTKYGNSYLIDIEQFRGSDEFRDLMGYINTAEHKQMKGALGSVK